MKAGEVRTKAEKELVKMVAEKHEELFGLKLKLSLGQLSKGADIRSARRDIARLLTILKEKSQVENKKDKGKYGNKRASKN